MKKLVSILLVLVLALALTPAMAEGPAYDGSEVTITFYNTMGTNLTPVLEKYIASFQELYPNIKVNYTSVGSYDDVRDQIATEITVNGQPNIAYCYPDHVALYNLFKAVRTLDDFIDSTAEVTRADGTTEIMGLTAEQKADFIEGYYNEGLQFGDGKMYTMPFSKSTEVLYYNKTFFDENGLQVPTTWDEMDEVARKIIEIDPDSTPIGYDSESNWFITMTEQLKSDYTVAEDPYFLFNNETNRDFVKRFREWYQDGLLITYKLNGGYTSGRFVADSKKIYMTIGSSAGASHQTPAAKDGVAPFEVGITTIPQADPSNPRVISQGPSVCIFKKANAQEEAASWLFVKYLTTSVEFQAEFSIASGYVPVIKSVIDNPIYAEHLANAGGYGEHTTALSAKICLEQVDAYYTSPAFTGSSTARDQVGELLAKCFSIPDSEDVDAKILEYFEAAVKECVYSR